MTNDFNKCTAFLKFMDGRTEIICRLGLWSVRGLDEAAVISNAIHYFEQYKSDGEYSSILGGDDVMTVLNKNRGE